MARGLCRNRPLGVGVIPHAPFERRFADLKRQGDGAVHLEHSPASVSGLTSRRMVSSDTSSRLREIGDGAGAFFLQRCAEWPNGVWYTHGQSLPQNW